MDPAWRTIDWNALARTVHNQVCSWLGQGAYATIDCSTVCIMKTRLITEDGRVGPPGSVIACGEGTLTMQCGDRPLEILAYTEHVDV